MTTLKGEKNVMLLKAIYGTDTVIIKLLPKTRTGEKCGNGTCEEGEDTENCPEDCKPSQIAGLDLVTGAITTAMAIIGVILIARVYYTIRNRAKKGE
ncbi:MAG: hypothetical protein JW772_01590 [Candidatus Diapherotrites archaeon]|nr:hypothetical protein [Candidatus Diapherotrites archaeon]